MKKLGSLLLLGLAFALPARAQAGEATIVTRDVPVGAARVLASTAPSRFDLVGVQWRGPGTVEFRTRSLDGRWSEWVDAAPEAEDRPDVGTSERARSGGWRLGNPWWVGPSDRIEYRRAGVVSRLRAHFVRSEVSYVPSRTLQRAGAPAIMPRAGWKADESIVRSKPALASELRIAIVHHTAGANGYDAAQSAAIVRAIQVYHVKGNGWNDIGYNFLVDRFGKVFEGRGGGIDENVVGAHAEGFNTGSVGVAVLGEYGSLAVAQAARDSLARLLAWRLDAAHIDPLSTLSFISNGNQRFPSGVPVFLRVVSGHRDTGFTDCPGTALYSLLNGLAGSVQAVGLPKLYAPLVTGTVPGKVRFRARLSSALPWSVDVLDASGTPIAGTTGQGANVDWTWDASRPPNGSLTYSIEAGAANPATGSLEGTVAGPAAELAIVGLAADPETISPNDDGAADASSITYTLNDGANVVVSVQDAAGETVQTLPRSFRRAGEHAVRFDALELPDGIYTISLEAKGTGGRIASASLQVAVTRTLGGFISARPAFSPNGDGRADRVAFRFVLAAPAEVRLRVLRDGKWVATPFTGPLPAGPQRLEWDGSKRVGRLLDGSYDAVLEAADPIGTARIAVPIVSDTRAPRVRILQRFPLKLELSEPGELTVRAGGRSFKRRAATAGAVPIFGIPREGIVRVVAWDPAGNPSRPVSRR
ncbi:MAG: N-acetylmuramoyl-L-alanine amidase [Gaiellaceae bacterium MAG52_C11]|nr:N-acetylmuramoyl-L-alanine amidase [Candidatus Gaiellasilicea maunaloa]